MTELTDSFRRLATLAHERAEEYRAPYMNDPEQDGVEAFAMSGSYGIYSSLMELSMLLRKLADELEAEEPKN